MTKVKEFHITCDVLESDSITVAMNDKGMTNIFMYIMFNDEPITKHQLLSREETLNLIQVLSVCMYEDRKKEVKEGARIEETVSIMSDASRKRAYLYLGVDCIGLNKETCMQLRDELEGGLN
ncbi:hypothetical protein BCPG1_185 [Bacillus phage BCPG1]|nr:hypothetical protein BCPG1_185 [Bacillus phage BCPG1]